jgi:hypothetical protein
MSSPQPMATPNLAELLTKRSARPPSERVISSPIAVPFLDAAPADGPDGVEGPAAGRGVAKGSTPADPEVFSGQPPTAVAGEQREYLRSIALYLPRTLHHQLGTAAADVGVTRTALILGAINGTHARLGPALAAPAPTVRRDDLFVVPQNKPSSEPSVQTTIRVTDAQYAAIAALVAEHHTNRSRLIATALELHLAQTGQDDQGEGD